MICVALSDLVSIVMFLLHFSTSPWPDATGCHGMPPVEVWKKLETTAGSSLVEKSAILSERLQCLCFCDESSLFSKMLRKKNMKGSSGSRDSSD